MIEWSNTNIQNTNSLKLIDITIQAKATEKALISDFSYQVQPGTVLTIMGESGVGKSTLLNLITGVIDVKCVFLYRRYILWRHKPRSTPP